MNRIIRNTYIKFLFLSFLCVTLIVTNIFAFAGWYKDGNKMAFLNNDGYRLANTWKESDGVKYYLGSDGYVVYNTVFEYNGYIYYVDKSGRRVSNRFVDVTADMIAGSDATPGIFYFGPDGKAYNRSANKFIKTIDGKKYAFTDDYHLVVDTWLNLDGDPITSYEDYLNDGYYYAKRDGVLLQNEWYDFSSDVGADAEYSDSIYISSDYGNMNKLWMYFGQDCKKYYAKDSLSKKLKLNGYEYAFDERGIMILGFERQQAEVDYNQQSNPVIKEKIKFFNTYSGALGKNEWIYTTTPESFDEIEYNDGKYYWFYVANDGSIVKNKVRTINGNKYIFDGFGRLKHGFIISDGVGQYVADYKAEDLSKDDFVFSVAEGGHLYGSDLADLFYFNEAEDKEEGVMRKGNIKIELSDGTYEFGFKSTGRAIGNKNTLTLYKDSYYKNGIKYVPWEDTRYGIIKISDDEYKVINSTGKVIKAKRKLIKDDYGNYIVILNNRLAGYIVEPIRKTQIKWDTVNGITGYHFYDRDYEKKTYAGVAVASGTLTPKSSEIADIPDDLKVNFK